MVPMYIKYHPASATMLLAKEKLKQIKGAYNAEGYPTNILIDKGGVIRQYQSGMGAGVPKKLREWIDEALGAPARK